MYKRQVILHSISQSTVNVQVHIFLFHIQRWQLEESADTELGKLPSGEIISHGGSEEKITALLNANCQSGYSVALFVTRFVNDRRRKSMMEALPKEEGHDW